MVGKKLDQNGYRRLRQSWIRRSHYVAGLFAGYQNRINYRSLPYSQKQTDTHAKIDNLTRAIT